MGRATRQAGFQLLCDQTIITVILAEPAPVRECRGMAKSCPELAEGPSSMEGKP